MADDTFNFVPQPTPAQQGQSAFLESQAAVGPADESAFLEGQTLTGPPKQEETAPTPPAAPSAPLAPPQWAEIQDDPRFAQADVAQRRSIYSKWRDDVVQYRLNQGDDPNAVKTESEKFTSKVWPLISDSGQGRVSSEFDTFGNAAQKAISESIAGTARLVGATDYAQTIQERLKQTEEANPENPRFENDYSTRAVRAVGGALPILATAAIPGVGEAGTALNLASKILPATAFAAAQAKQASFEAKYQEKIAQGADPQAAANEADSFSNWKSFMAVPETAVFLGTGMYGAKLAGAAAKSGFSATVRGAAAAFAGNTVAADVNDNLDAVVDKALGYDAHFHVTPSFEDVVAGAAFSVHPAYEAGAAFMKRQRVIGSIFDETHPVVAAAVKAGDQALVEQWKDQAAVSAYTGGIRTRDVVARYNEFKAREKQTADDLNAKANAMQDTSPKTAEVIREKAKEVEAGGAEEDALAGFEDIIGEPEPAAPIKIDPDTGDTEVPEEATIDEHVAASKAVGRSRMKPKAKEKAQTVLAAATEKVLAKTVPDPAKPTKEALSELSTDEKYEQELVEAGITDERLDDVREKIARSRQKLDALKEAAAPAEPKPVEPAAAAIPEEQLPVDPETHPEELTLPQAKAIMDLPPDVQAEKYPELQAPASKLVADDQIRRDAEEEALRAANPPIPAEERATTTKEEDDYSALVEDNIIKPRKKAKAGEKPSPDEDLSSQLASTIAPILKKHTLTDEDVEAIKTGIRKRAAGWLNRAKNGKIPHLFNGAETEAARKDFVKKQVAAWARGEIKTRLTANKEAPETVSLQGEAADSIQNEVAPATTEAPPHPAEGKLQAAVAKMSPAEQIVVDFKQAKAGLGSNRFTKNSDLLSLAEAIKAEVPDFKKLKAETIRDKHLEHVLASVARKLSKFNTQTKVEFAAPSTNDATRQAKQAIFQRISELFPKRAEAERVNDAVSHATMDRLSGIIKILENIPSDEAITPDELIAQIQNYEEPPSTPAAETGEVRGATDTVTEGSNEPRPTGIAPIPAEELPQTPAVSEAGSGAGVEPGPVSGGRDVQGGDVGSGVREQSGSGQRPGDVRSESDSARSQRAESLRARLAAHPPGGHLPEDLWRDLVDYAKEIDDEHLVDTNPKVFAALVRAGLGNSINGHMVELAGRVRGSTPTEPITLNALREGRNAKTDVVESYNFDYGADHLLGWMMQQTGIASPFMRQLADAIRKSGALKGVKVRVGEVDSEYGAMSERGDHGKWTITMAPDFVNHARFQRAFMEEAIHVTLGDVVSDFEAGRTITPKQNALLSRIQYSFLSARKQLIGDAAARDAFDALSDTDKGDRYGLKNLQEFVANAVKSPGFQTLLEKVPVTKSTNAWTNIKAAVKSFFGIQNNPHGDVIDSVMDLVRTVDKNLSKPARTGRVTPTDYESRTNVADPLTGAPTRITSDAGPVITRGDTVAAGDRERFLTARNGIAAVRSYLKRESFGHEPDVELANFLRMSDAQFDGEKKNLTTAEWNALKKSREYFPRTSWDKIAAAVGSPEIAKPLSMWEKYDKDPSRAAHFIKTLQAETEKVLGKGKAPDPGDALFNIQNKYRSPIYWAQEYYSDAVRALAEKSTKGQFFVAGGGIESLALTDGTDVYKIAFNRGDGTAGYMPGPIRETMKYRYTDDKGRSLLVREGQAKLLAKLHAKQNPKIAPEGVRLGVDGLVGRPISHQLLGERNGLKGVLATDVVGVTPAGDLILKQSHAAGREIFHGTPLPTGGASAVAEAPFWAERGNAEPLPAMAPGLSGLRNDVVQHPFMARDALGHFHVVIDIRNSNVKTNGRNMFVFDPMTRRLTAQEIDASPTLTAARDRLEQRLGPANPQGKAVPDPYIHRDPLRLAALREEEAPRVAVNRTMRANEEGLAKLDAKFGEGVGQVVKDNLGKASLRDALQLKGLSQEQAQITANHFEQEYGKELNSLKRAEKSPFGVGLLPGFIDIYDPLVKTFDAGRRFLNTLPTRENLAAWKNAGKNRSIVHANQWTNKIAEDMRQAFQWTDDRWEKIGYLSKAEQARRKLDRNALSVAVEAQGEQKNLDVMRQKIMTALANPGLSSDKDWVGWANSLRDAIDHADANWAKLLPIADSYEKIHRNQIRVENKNGIAGEERKGYVHHMQDLDFDEDYLGGVGGVGGDGRSFTHARTHDTFADSLAAGVKPVSIDALDSMNTRLRKGTQLLMNQQWREAGRSIMDPTTNLPLVTDLLVKKNAAGETIDVVVGDPQHYRIGDFGGGKVAVHKSYAGIYESLTNPSWVRQNAGGRMLMTTAGNIKHGILVFDTYHLGRLALYQVPLRGKATFDKGLILLDYLPSEIHRMEAQGRLPKGITANDILKRKADVDLLLRQGYNIGTIQEKLHTTWAQKLPLIGAFNKFTFDKFQRGGMVESALIQLDRTRQQFPNLSDEQAARKVARELNTRFGNLQQEGWFKSATGRDLAQLFFLAPAWNEGLIKSEFGSYKNLVTAANDVAHLRAPRIGALLRSSGSLMVGMFVANQLINYMSRGIPTWENPEGAEDWQAKLSAFIPDAGGGPGFFLNPFALPFEITHQITGVMHKKNTSLLGAVNEVLGYKASPLGQAGRTLVTHKDRLGRSIPDDSMSIMGNMIKSMLPVPIPAQIIGPSVEHYAKYGGTPKFVQPFPGAGQRQAFATFGVKLDAAPSDLARMYTLGKRFTLASGREVDPDTNPSAYRELDQAIQGGDLNAAQREYDHLIQTGHTRETIAQRFQKLPVFTGQKQAFETKFRQSLNEEQLATYKRAVQGKKDLGKAFRSLHLKATPTQ